MSNFGASNSGFFNGGTNGGGGSGVIILGTGTSSSLRCGAGNIASGNYSTTFGTNNTSSGTYSTVGGGFDNFSTNSSSLVSGGRSNCATQIFSTVGGGFFNNSTNLGSTISGGVLNISSESYSTVSGGYCNTASGCASTISGGYINTASGCFSNVSGGYGNIATAPFSSVQGGSNACAYLLGMRANANVSLGIPADNQNSILFANTKPSLTSGGTSILYLDGTVATITPSGSNRLWSVNLQYGAVVVSKTGTATGVNVGDVKTHIDLFNYKKVGGVGTVSTITSAANHSDASMATADMTYANNAGSLQITFVAPTFTGGGTVTFKVAATLQLTELAW